MATKDELVNELDAIVAKRELAENEAAAWAKAGQSGKAEASELLAEGFNRRIAEVLAELADELPG